MIHFAADAKQSMRRLVRFILLYIPAVLLASVIVLCLAMTERAALVPTHLTITPEVVAQAKQVLSIWKQQWQSDNTQHRMVFSESDIRSLFVFTSRLTPRLSGDVKIEQGQAEIIATLFVPENPFGDYLNFRFIFPNSDNKLRLEKLVIGDVSVGEKTAEWLLYAGISLVFGDEQSSAVRDIVKKVDNRHGYMLVTYQPSEHLDEKLIASLEKWQSGASAEDLEARTAATSYYFGRLCHAPYSTSTVSLVRPLSDLFAAASKRSKTSKQAVLENQAVMLALTLFYGTEQIDLLSRILKIPRLSCSAVAGRAYLEGRQDLAQHFLYSATIQVLSDQNVSFAMGEWKELSDSLKGGSGFSFVDLAADMTGIRFVSLASQEKSALSLQQKAAKFRNEESFFPKVDGLTEGISQVIYEHEYAGIEKQEKYHRMLAQINVRIQQVPLYR